MSKRSKSTKASRREFLKGMALIGGAALTVVTRPGAADVLEVTGKPDSPKPKGYHVTPHILDYYEKART